MHNLVISLSRVDELISDSPYKVRRNTRWLKSSDVVGELVVMEPKLQNERAWLEYDIFPIVGHVQIADVPRHHDPGTGEINYSSIFTALRDLGYQGFVGLEYRPSSSTDASLGWFTKYQSR